MKFVIVSLLFTLAVFFNSIELTSSADTASRAPYEPDQVEEFHPHNRMPHVYFYLNQYGDPIRITERTMPQKLEENELLIFGVVLNGRVYPIFNRRQQQVLVLADNGQNIVMTPGLLEEYGSIYSRPIPRPNPVYTNNGLPPRPPRSQTRRANP